MKEQPRENHNSRLWIRNRFSVVGIETGVAAAALIAGGIVAWRHHEHTVEDQRDAELKASMDALILAESKLVFMNDPNMHKYKKGAVLTVAATLMSTPERLTQVQIAQRARLDKKLALAGRLVLEEKDFLLVEGTEGSNSKRQGTSQTYEAGPELRIAYETLDQYPELAKEVSRLSGNS